MTINMLAAVIVLAMAAVVISGCGALEQARDRDVRLQSNPASCEGRLVFEYDPLFRRTLCAVPINQPVK